jgi:hypothetical protein
MRAHATAPGQAVAHPASGSGRVVIARGGDRAVPAAHDRQRRALAADVARRFPTPAEPSVRSEGGERSSTHLRSLVRALAGAMRRGDEQAAARLQQQIARAATTATGRITRGETFRRAYVGSLTRTDEADAERSLRRDFPDEFDALEAGWLDSSRHVRGEVEAYRRTEQFLAAVGRALERICR